MRQNWPGSPAGSICFQTHSHYGPNSFFAHPGRWRGGADGGGSQGQASPVPRLLQASHTEGSENRHATGRDRGPLAPGRLVFVASDPWRRQRDPGARYGSTRAGPVRWAQEEEITRLKKERKPARAVPRDSKKVGPLLGVSREPEAGLL